MSSLKFRPGQPQSVRFCSFLFVPSSLTPVSYPQIYSSSYDGTVRQHHFEQGMSEEVLDGDRWSDEGLIHSFDFDSTGNEIWGMSADSACRFSHRSGRKLIFFLSSASDNNGGLIFRDLRTPKDEAKRWNIDGYKGAFPPHTAFWTPTDLSSFPLFGLCSPVGCVSINPANPRLAATAHLKRTMRCVSPFLLLPRRADSSFFSLIPRHTTPPRFASVLPHFPSLHSLWDLTALRGLDEDSPVATVLETALLQEYAHEKAVSSAYFDWTGTRLASTSYDDAIRGAFDTPFFLLDETLTFSFLPHRSLGRRLAEGLWLP